jgi:hypothetical protein
MGEHDQPHCGQHDRRGAQHGLQRRWRGQRDDRAGPGQAGHDLSGAGPTAFRRRHASQQQAVGGKPQQ